METDSKIIIGIGIIVAIILVGAVFYSAKNNKIPGELDGFASCLAEKEAKFFGAFWCPHCQAQKKLFGRSVSKLPYIECSTPNGQAQTQICIDSNVESYPTWEFADGTRVTGEQTLAFLAEKTGCELPVTQK